MRLWKLALFVASIPLAVAALAILERRAADQELRRRIARQP